MTGIGNVNLTDLTWATNIVLGSWLRFDIWPHGLAASYPVVASLVLAILLQKRPLRGALPDALLPEASLGPAHRLGGARIVGGGV